MKQAVTLFVGMFATLLAIINPLEALPVFLNLLEGKDEKQRLLVARRSCVYATLLMFFFLLFGTLLLRIFGVPLSMVRIVGGFILMRIGFNLFSSPSSGASMTSAASGSAQTAEDVAFTPLAMPIMFGPGAMATVIGITSLAKQSGTELLSFAAASAAIVATMFVTYLFLVYSKQISRKIGPRGIDAATRIVGFFVAAIGMGLIFNGVIEALQTYGVIPAR